MREIKFVKMRFGDIMYWFDVDHLNEGKIDFSNDNARMMHAQFAVDVVRNICMKNRTTGNEVESMVDYIASKVSEETKRVTKEHNPWIYQYGQAHDLLCRDKEVKKYVQGSDQPAYSLHSLAQLHAAEGESTKRGIDWVSAKPAMACAGRVCI